MRSKLPLCKNSYLCEFEPHLTNSEAQVEHCIRCGRNMVYWKEILGFRFENGRCAEVIRGPRIDNYKYYEDHIAWFAQPFGRTKKIFNKMYGNDPIKALEKRKYKPRDTRSWGEIRKDIEKQMKNPIYR